MGIRISESAKQTLEKVGKRLNQFKYPLLLLLLGVVLVVFPLQSRDTKPKTEAVAETVPVQELSQTDDLAYLERMQDELAEILSQIDGAGRVRVMLTLRTGNETCYQTDTERTTQSGDGSAASTVRETTVILSRGSAYDEAAVVKTEYPIFQGALIVAEGAENARVCLAIKNAVSALLCVGTDKITVVKMK